MARRNQPAMKTWSSGRDPGAPRGLGDHEPRTVLGVCHVRPSLEGDQARSGDVDCLEASHLEDSSPVSPRAMINPTNIQIFIAVWMC